MIILVQELLKKRNVGIPRWVEKKTEATGVYVGDAHDSQKTISQKQCSSVSLHMCARGM